MKKKVICFGEVLWDDFGSHKTIGGAPLNVGYHLSKFNIEPLVVSQVGKDASGEALLTQLADWEVNIEYCPVTPDYPTSTVEVQVEKNGDVHYRICEEVAWDYLAFDEQLASEIEVADAFIYGTLAARGAQTRDVLMTYIRLARWPILDLNLRQPYTDKRVIIELVRTCKTIKLNLEELYYVMELLGETVVEEAGAVGSLFERFDNIAEVVLTKGAEGAVYYNRETSIVVKGITVDVKDTVGSGDSFLAAFVGGRLMNKSNEKLLQDALILSAFVATLNGGCPPYSLSDLENFKKKFYEKKL